MSPAEPRGTYGPPPYRAPEGATWLHALHGNVPEHQIDFICCPEAPQGAFTHTHLGHLGRLMPYIDPAGGAPFAFAIGNLSRDDTQHEPGHGAIALLFGLRMIGETDSLGRPDPPLAHAIVAVDRELTADALLAATLTLHGHLLGGAGQCTPEAFHRQYVHAMATSPADVPDFLAWYFAGFHDLPSLRASTLARHLSRSTDTRPRRIFLLLDGDHTFARIARAASRIAAILYRSGQRWTAITFGSRVDIAGGLSVAFVPSPPDDFGPDDLVLRLADLPEDDSGIARALLLTRPLLQRMKDFPLRRTPRPQRAPRPGDTSSLLQRLLRRSQASTPGMPPGSAAGATRSLGPVSSRRTPLSPPSRPGWRNAVLTAGDSEAPLVSRTAPPRAVWLHLGVFATLLILASASLLAARGRTTSHPMTPTAVHPQSHARPVH
ncbi:hypothetical protein [Chondromyces apiculatus]|uniref:Uncharacterized protein n=1 Tax=Chondromyces apiculatus DSM 436 TaxID=1192034 RepID=A0A017SXX7_9BACT|nr:hypothetical protein [Chondromyces apiculatus]EYF01141.1 Hypothetical protein CAP_8564 [Chondromyces apiculatus DSM 436]